MVNQIKKTQDIIRECGEILKNIKKQGAIIEEQQKKLAEVMSDDEVAEYVSQKKKKTQDAIKQTRDGRKQTEGFQQTIKTRKEDIALIKKVAERTGMSFEEAYNILHGGDELKKKVSNKKESKETSTNLPSDVATQEKKAIAYFEKNNEAENFKVVDHVKNLREQGKITYEDLGGGKYNVIMPCGSKKLKMYFPADTHLSYVNCSYTNFDDKEISKKETTREKLWSKEGEKYVEQKEMEGQKMLSESEFKTLIQSLYPEGTQEDQILAFMMATGFYGRMRLSDKTGSFQRAVRCYRLSDTRYFLNLSHGHYSCSLVHSTFIG